MKMIPMALAAALMAGAASAGGTTSVGAFKSSAFSSSGFASFGQRGDFQVGAMNESYGFAGIGSTCSNCGTGAEVNTSGGSTSEGFGSNFRGISGASGFGGGRAFGGFSVRR